MAKKSYVTKAESETKILGFKQYKNKTYSARLLEDRMPCNGCAFYHSASVTRACTKPESFGSCIGFHGNEYHANIFWIEEKPEPETKNEKQKCNSKVSKKSAPTTEASQTTD